jgi:hypothetical protein
MQDRQRYFEAPGAAVSAEQVPRPVRPCPFTFVVTV